MGQEPEFNELEEKFHEVKAEQIAEKAVEKIEESNSVFTKTGRIFNPSEAHPFEIGAGLAFLAYLIHPAFFGVHFALMVKAIVDKYIRDRNPTGLIDQIAEELHYYVIGTVLMVALLHSQGYAPPDVTIRGVEIMRILVGA